MIGSWWLALDHIWGSGGPSLTLLLGPALSRAHGGILRSRLGRLWQGCSRWILGSILGNNKKICLKLAKTNKQKNHFVYALVNSLGTCRVPKYD